MHKHLIVSEFDRDVPGSLDTARANLQKTTSRPAPILEPMHELLVSLVPKPLVGAFEDVSEAAVKVEPVQDVVGRPYRGTRATPRAAKVPRDVKVVDHWPGHRARPTASQRQAVRGSGVAYADEARKPNSTSKPPAGADPEVISPSFGTLEPVQESGFSAESCEPPFMASVFGADFTTGSVLRFLRSGYARPQKPETSTLNLSLISESGSSSELDRWTPGLMRGRPTAPPQSTKSLPISAGLTIWDRPPTVEDTMTPAEEPPDLTWIFLVMVVVAVFLMVTMYVSYVVNMARWEKARATAMSKPTFPPDEAW